MAMVDIGNLLFSEILRISAYPGAPFTGDPVRDLVMFFFVPTIFLIMFIFIIVNRVGGHPKISLLLGIGIYMYVLASGYFEFFVLLAGPYFVVLIFILGVIWFVFQGGFGIKKRDTGMAYASQETQLKEAARHMKPGLRNLLPIPVINPGKVAVIEREIKRLDKQIEYLQHRLDELDRKGIGAAHGRGDLEKQLIELRNERFLLEERLKGRITDN